MSRLLYSILWGVVFLLMAFTLVLSYECVFGESPPASVSKGHLRNLKVAKIRRGATLPVEQVRSPPPHSPIFIDAYNCILSDADVQVYDGDTIKDVRVLLLEQDFEKWQLGEYWPGVHITERGVEIQTDVRIAGIDTPEKRTSTKNADGSPRSQASRQREKAAAAASRQALILMLKSNGNHFSISDPIHGKYAGRTVADVHVNEVDVATYLIQKGHAKFYDGGTKPEWNWGD